jgi:hypothetical protein
MLLRPVQLPPEQDGVAFVLPGLVEQLIFAIESDTETPATTSSAGAGVSVPVLV